ncbi:DUF4062 domain-containing protein [Paenibacillus swuensis]|uniref:DUF4062 domain-containing protein n=1 Tax=Paenibacillus swuensis TaxID=1178515 RepID=UPI00083820F3|nr:DUF4062 domain-containing protein [Paenibacillus swuensis]
MLKLFLSSTIRDLYYVRSVLANAVENELGHQVAISESYDFDMTNEGIIESCLREIDGSDVYILILGKEAGSIITERGISITRAEYRHALAASKPVFVLIQQEAWTLHRDQSSSLTAAQHDFIREVSDSFKHNVHPFVRPDEAYRYIRAQLSVLLKNYLKIGLSVPRLHDIIKKYKEFSSMNYLFQSMIQYSWHFDGDFERLLSVFSGEIVTGTLRDHLHFAELSPISGATLYVLDEEENELIKVGSCGNVGGRHSFRLDDRESYVSGTYLSAQVKLFQRKDLGRTECMMCMPLAANFVLTLHFFIIGGSADAVPDGFILDKILDNNKMRFDYLNLYLERTDSV